MESYGQLLERYRSNNCELALALNDLKVELDTMNKKLLAKENDFQAVHSENAILRKELAQRDAQINNWRAAFVDLVQSNTRKYTEVMQQIGLVPTANSINKTNSISNQTSTSTRAEMSTTPLTTKHLATDDRVNALRRRRFSLDYESPNNRLANLTEENSQINDSSSLTPNSPITKCHVTARRRVSVPPVSPISSPRKKPKDKKMEIEKKTDSKPMLKIPEINDENIPQNTKGRPSRRTAPKSLAEPKLSTKLRRN